MIPRVARRYDPVTKFLKETIDNEKIAHRVRMQAVMRLSEIYLQHDISKERKAIAIERAQARVAEAEAQNNPTPIESQLLTTPQTPEDAQRAANEFLERIRMRSKQNVEQ